MLGFGNEALIHRNWAAELVTLQFPPPEIARSPGSHWASARPAAPAATEAVTAELRLVRVPSWGVRTAAGASLAL